MASLTMNSLSFYEPMRKNWFIVQFSDANSQGDTSNNEALTIACKSCDVPRLTTTDNVIDRINDKVYTPGKSEYETISMSFYEYIQDNITNDDGNKNKSAGEILYKWQQSIHDVKTGKQGAKKQIAKNVAIVQIDGNGNAIRVWNIYKAWPTAVEFANLDSAEGSIQDVNVTLRFDWAEQRNAQVTVSSGSAGTLV